MDKIQMAATPPEYRALSRKPIDPAISMPGMAKTKITAAVTAAKIEHVFVCASGTFKMSAG